MGKEDSLRQVALSVGKPETRGQGLWGPFQPLLECLAGSFPGARGGSRVVGLLCVPIAHGPITSCRFSSPTLTSQTEAEKEGRGLGDTGRAPGQRSNSVQPSSPETTPGILWFYPARPLPAFRPPSPHPLHRCLSPKPHSRNLEAQDPGSCFWLCFPIVRLGFPCDSAGKESACNAGDLGSIPGLGRSPGAGKNYPF